MIKKYTVMSSSLGRDAGMQAFVEVKCDIELDPDNGQGMTIDKLGNLMFTVDNNDVVLFAAGTWAKVTSV